VIRPVAAINMTHGDTVFSPSWLGKASTLLQIVTAGVVLLLNALAAELPAVEYLFQLSFGLTVGSAAHYAWLASGSSRRTNGGRRKSERLAAGRTRCTGITPGPVGRIGGARSGAGRDPRRTPRLRDQIPSFRRK